MGGWPSIVNAKTVGRCRIKGDAIDQSIGGIRGPVEFMTDGHVALIKAVHSVGKHGTYRVTIDNFRAKVRKI